MKSIRVRFAPSPTGHLHIGGLRTALFNWLFARHHGGAFLLRIEDTDRERSYPKFVDSILTSLQWAGLSSDEPLLFQSERFGIYRQEIKRLVDEGKAYRCFCPPSPEKIGEAYFKYDGKCRSLPVSPEQEKVPHVIRFKFPLDIKEINFSDLLRGPISFSADQFDDFIIMRTDDTPVYNVCVVIDDNAQKISHVIRGEEHLVNTPKQLVLYQAFGFDVPEFVHLPLILGSSGQKLSKREAAVSVLEYKEQGYFPQALCNYLARLGWSHGDQEIFTRDELIQLFSLENVGKSGSIFDINKLKWLNSTYIRQETPPSILTYILRDINPDLLSQLSSWTQEKILSLIALYKERVNTLLELVEDLNALYAHSRIPTQEDLDAWVTADTPKYLGMIIKGLGTIEEFSSQALSKFLKEFSTIHGLKLVNVAQPLRLALTGKASGPGVFELLAVVGKEESIQRIEQFMRMLIKVD